MHVCLLVVRLHIIYKTGGLILKMLSHAIHAGIQESNLDWFYFRDPSKNNILKTKRGLCPRYSQFKINILRYSQCLKRKLSVSINKLLVKIG